MSDISQEDFIKTECGMNLVLNSKERTEEKVRLDSKPSRLIVTVNNICNLKCIMCGDQPGYWDFPETREEELFSLYKYLTEIHWQGGEVFLSDYFKKLFDEASEAPFITQHINTNGLLINDDWAEKLTNARVELDYSIDSFEKQTYEFIRQGGLFADLIKSIELINRYTEKNKEGKLRKTFNFVVMKSNYREIENCIEFARKHNFSKVQLSPVFNMESESIYSSVEKDEIKNYLKDIIAQLTETALSLGIGFSSSLQGLEAEVSRPFDSKYDYLFSLIYKITDEKKDALFCRSPWTTLFIESNGVIYPDCICEKPVGNLKSDTIAQLWNNPKMILYRKNIIHNKMKDFCSRECLKC